MVAVGHWPPPHPGFVPYLAHCGEAVAGDFVALVRSKWMKIAPSPHGQTYFDVWDPAGGWGECERDRINAGDARSRAWVWVWAWACDAGGLFRGSFDETRPGSPEGNFQVAFHRVSMPGALPVWIPQWVLS
jgi:hypothetical protein